ncbi:hypothetical protein RF11_05356 [Thelohanellus kitauei]|uniref:HTH CENPB-type domain-containing protein n=1 Tax=Thelohanellus kitauei TaxID=669202 RepID=A0A0C2NB02_THEKT|nr:hypothetical protein RF11_05356 [Thelohanellus kitauei]
MSNWDKIPLNWDSKFKITVHMLHVFSRKNMYREFDMMCSLIGDRRDVSRSYSVTNTPRALRLSKLVLYHLPYRVFYDRKVNCVRNWYYKKDKQELPKEHERGRIQTCKGVNINDPILKPKSEELDIKLGRNDFKATDGWLSRWKARHYIQFKKAHGEKGSVDNESVEQ